jgi:hypothetical protein
VDDLIFIAQPSILQNVSELQRKILDLLKELGIQMNERKFLPFASVFPFIGFSWDIKSKSVQLLDKKRIKYLKRIDE